MFQAFKKNDFAVMFGSNAVYFNSARGVLAKSFYSNKLLTKTLSPTSFAFDRAGNLTVSSFEFKEYPIYGTQFQTDKAAYTVTDEKYIHHSITNIQLNRKFPDFFVEECKMNYHKFANKRAEDRIIFEDMNTKYRRHKYVYLLSDDDDIDI